MSAPFFDAAVFDPLVFDTSEQAAIVPLIVITKGRGPKGANINRAWRSNMPNRSAVSRR